MSKAFYKKNMIVDTPFRYEVSNEDGTSPAIKKIEFKPANITQLGDKVNADDINGIQENSIYEVEAVRVVEGVNEFYDIAITGINDFNLFNAKLLIKFNETNTKVNPQLRILWNSLNKVYPIRFLNDFADIQVNIGDLKKEYIGYINQVSNKFLLWDLYGSSEKIFYFDTMQDAQNASWLVAGDIIEVLGYYVKRDGGGHKRIISSVVDSYSSVLLNNGLYANYLVTSDKIRPSEFGCYCDGVTDDISNLQKSVNFAIENRLSLSLIGSKFYISSTLNLTSLKMLYCDLNSYIKVNSTKFIGNYAVTIGDPTVSFGSGRSTLNIKGQLYVFSENRTNALNGVYIKGSWLNIDYIRAYNFKGIGIEIDSVWDSNFGKLSVEFCGSNNNYALKAWSNGDTFNTTNISSIQCEKPVQKGLYIDAIRSTISNIHSEGLYLLNTDSGYINNLILLQNSTVTQALFSDVGAGVTAPDGETTVSGSPSIYLKGVACKFSEILAESSKLICDYGTNIIFENILSYDFIITSSASYVNVTNIKCLNIFSPNKKCYTNGGVVNVLTPSYLASECVFENLTFTTFTFSNNITGGLVFKNCIIPTIGELKAGSPITIFDTCKITTVNGAWNSTAKFLKCSITTVDLTSQSAFQFFDCIISTFSCTGNKGFITKNCIVNNVISWAYPTTVSYPAGTLTENPGYVASGKIWQNTNGSTSWSALI